jgi:cytochrome c oxidase subunit 4
MREGGKELRRGLLKTGEKKFHKADHRTYVLVWIGLLILTGITVSLAGMNLKGLSILVPLLVAATKSGLVLSYFMHLKYETGLLFKLMIPIVLAALTIFIGLTFSDVAFR